MGNAALFGAYIDGFVSIGISHVLKRDWKRVASMAILCISKNCEVSAALDTIESWQHFEIFQGFHDNSSMPSSLNLFEVLLPLIVNHETPTGTVEHALDIVLDCIETCSTQCGTPLYSESIRQVCSQAYALATRFGRSAYMLAHPSP